VHIPIHYDAAFDLSLDAIRIDGLTYIMSSDHLLYSSFAIQNDNVSGVSVRNVTYPVGFFGVMGSVTQSTLHRTRGLPVRSVSVYLVLLQTNRGPPRCLAVTSVCRDAVLFAVGHHRVRSCT